ncbi:MAG TPA: Glu-tRNA(Gln) amidotransferase subunit GatE [Candidatus Krumholzibacteria bacterium]|nr:Glu-tRNA(Gln) amidotransferase subunit GatE [Candidatus Krumholzibacteria bacterium]
MSVRQPADFNPRQDPPLDFPVRDLEAMTRADYHELGFMSGLEVHQQLWTRRKLFCRCPSGRYVRNFDVEVLRHMRPTLSELGEYDGTALMEFKTRKEIVYRLERGTVCTYEIDDTPPFEMDEEAIRIALEVCLLFDLNLVAELHVMRKQYLDGSIPAGFQRTSMVGLNGVIPFRVPELGVDKPLRIRQLSLEEDSCREVADIGHRITFRTDRLGMPLTEVVTEPDLLTPLEVHAGARLVAHTTRTSGRVRRGPGAARQDVNVSVAGGRRIEIKGVHHHRGLPRLVHIEGFRQLELLRLRAELHRRGVTRASLQLPEGKPWETSPLVLDATSILRGRDSVGETLQQGQMACALRLPGLAGILKHRTQPGLTFAHEIAERVRVIACLMAQPFMTHSDGDGEPLCHTDWRELRHALQASADDALIVLWGPEQDCATAAREVFLRLLDALDGVPAETRQAFPDGRTGFERILPGPDRMYPDTDTPPIPIPDAWVEQARLSLPERPWQKEDRYRQVGLDAAAAARLAVAPWAGLFDSLAPATPLAARRLQQAMEKRFPSWLRRSIGTRRPLALPPWPPAPRLAPLVRAVEQGALRPEALEPALGFLLADDERPAAEILARFQPQPEDGAQVESRLVQVLTKADDFTAPRREKFLRWAMGEVMSDLQGRVDPQHVQQRLAAALMAPTSGPVTTTASTTAASQQPPKKTSARGRAGPREKTSGGRAGAPKKTSPPRRANAPKGGRA